MYVCNSNTKSLKQKERNAELNYTEQRQPIKHDYKSTYNQGPFSIKDLTGGNVGEPLFPAFSGEMYAERGEVCTFVFVGETIIAREGDSV